MTKYEQLLDHADREQVEVHENYNFNSGRIKGLYCDHHIAISNCLQSNHERTAILAEELGHYHTSSGDITDQSNISNQKQEMRARRWGYDQLIGLEGIIDACNHHCRNISELADYLEVPEWFVYDCLSTYREKYGKSVTVGRYVIFFEPRLAVMQLLL